MTKIGVVGAGQLGRMLALAGIPLNLQFEFLDPSVETPASALGPCTRAAFDDMQALQHLAERCDVLTYEFENVSVLAMNHIATTHAVYPPPRALAVSQDRLIEKEFLRDLGLTTAEFRSIESALDIDRAASELGLPLILKTRRMGYDGRGQLQFSAGDDAKAAWQSLGEAPCIAEAVVPFEREVSLIAVRSLSGETAYYPLIENVHRQGILATSRAPAPQVSEELQLKAQSYADAIFSAISYVGVLTIEFFESYGQLIANEIAPRVHNSGHFSIEGSQTSQFENHLRAILGLPLGSTAPRGVSTMLNCVGEMPAREIVLKIPGAHLHDYGKSPKPNRKLGHVTICAATAKKLDARLALLNEMLPGQRD